MKSIFLVALSLCLLQTVFSVCVGSGHVGCSTRAATNIIQNLWQYEYGITSGGSIDQCCQACVHSPNCKFYLFFRGYTTPIAKPTKCYLVNYVIQDEIAELVSTPDISLGVPL
jgi:hypothetical protein